MAFGGLSNPRFCVLLSPALTRLPIRNLILRDVADDRTSRDAEPLCNPSLGIAFSVQMFHQLEVLFSF